MGRGLKYHGYGSKYHGYGVKIPCIGGQNTMGRGFDIPWIRGSKYHG